MSCCRFTPRDFSRRTVAKHKRDCVNASRRHPSARTSSTSSASRWRWRTCASTVYAWTATRTLSLPPASCRYQGHNKRKWDRATRRTMSSLAAQIPGLCLTEVRNYRQIRLSACDLSSLPSMINCNSDTSQHDSMRIFTLMYTGSNTPRGYISEKYVYSYPYVSSE